MKNKWFAFQAIASGVLLGFLQQRQMIFGLIALALILFGTMRLAEKSVWMHRADWCASILVPLTVLRQFSLPVAEIIGGLVIAGWLILGLLLSLGLADLMRRSEEKPLLEWGIFAAWIVYAALSAICGGSALLGQSEQVAFLLTPTNTVALFAHVALLVDTFRVQREYIGGNNE